MQNSNNQPSAFDSAAPNEASDTASNNNNTASSNENGNTASDGTNNGNGNGASHANGSGNGRGNTGRVATPSSVTSSATSPSTEATASNGNGRNSRNNGSTRKDANGRELIAIIKDGQTIIEPEFLQEVPGATREALNDNAATNGNGATRTFEKYAPPPPKLEEVPKPSESTVFDDGNRGRSLRMQWRFLQSVGFFLWLFGRIVIIQAYVSKIFPNWVTETNPARFVKYAREYADFSAKMGGVYIKAGQFVSTRADIFPEAVVKELETLQDEVPTLRFSKIKQAVEAQIGPIESRFRTFNERPIAAASLGQVHKATLLNGDKVVVKVQRPKIRELCFTDLDAMRLVANVAMWFRFVSRRSDAPALVEEFGHVLLQELSYKHEAYNAAIFANMFKDDMGIYIPAVYHEHSTDELLVLEDVSSIKITDYEGLERAGVSRKAVAKRLMDCYLEQIFQFYFFHADPHPGNLLVYPLPVDDPNKDFGPEGRPFYLIFVDFGMTGSLTKELADGMVSTLAAIIQQDARRLIESYMRLGFIRQNADVDRVVEAAQLAFDKVWGMSMTEIRSMDYDSIEALAEEFNEMMRTMPFYIPQDFIYLGRTVSILTGMTTLLDPEFNPWSELQPYTEVLIARGFGIDIPTGEMLSATNVMRGVMSGDTQMLRAMGQEIVKRTLSPDTPANNALRKLSDGDIQVVAKLSREHRQQLRRMELESRRVGRSVFFGSVLIAATLFYTSGETFLAAVGYIACLLTWIIGNIKD